MIVKILLSLIACFIINNTYALKQSSYFQSEMFSKPIVERSLIFSKMGFFPKTIVIHQHEKLKLYFTSLINGACFLMDAKNIFLTTNKGTIIEKEIYFKHSGRFEFNCPYLKSIGQIIVLAKNKKKIIKRNITSKDQEKNWIPRDE